MCLAPDTKHYLSRTISFEGADRASLLRSDLPRPDPTGSQVMVVDGLDLDSGCNTLTLSALRISRLHGRIVVTDAQSAVSSSDTNEYLA